MIIFVCLLYRKEMSRNGNRGNGSRSSRTSSRKSSGRKSTKSYPKFKGTVQMTREGFIFVIVEGQENDIYVKATKTKNALNGDIVLVAVTKEQRGDKRREGEVVEVLERSSRPHVGILHFVGAQAWLIMQSRTMPYDIAIDQEQALAMGGQTGMKAAVVVDRWERNEISPWGHVTDVLGFPGENETEMHAILAEFGLPYRFEKEVEDAADSISEVITAEDLKGRKDFRKTLTFTIDPADAKDFDDALSFRPLENGNFEVGVHIADVSYYVKPDTAVDKEAQLRGTSVYLVDRTVPMLPEKLCNKLCSLRPNEDKLTFSTVFEMDPKGKVVKRWIGRTVICSDHRYNYEEAQDILVASGVVAPAEDATAAAQPEGALASSALTEGDASSTKHASALAAGVVTAAIAADEASPQVFAEEVAIAGGAANANARRNAPSGAVKYAPDSCEYAIVELHKIAKLLRERRFKSGAISFERPEMKVDVDSNGKPLGVHEVISNESHWLIEEFMLLANRTVAEFIATEGKMNAVASKKAKTFVYRVHAEPNEVKLQGFREFAGGFGYKLGETTGANGVAKALNELLTSAKDKPEFGALEILALRCMAKATYTTDNIGHYGLAFKFYTHFTSPIRRYPDTMVHRLLAMYLDGKDSQSQDYYEMQCKHASEREIVAAEAERASIKYKLVEFMQDKVGQEFDGHVSGITEWGMYVEIDPTKIEGMVALRDIKSDYFEFDEEHYRLVGKRTKKMYRLGDPVRIKVKSTNLEQKLLDYELVETN